MTNNEFREINSATTQTFAQRQTLPSPNSDGSSTDNSGGTEN